MPNMNALYMQGKKPKRHAITSIVSNLHNFKHDYLFSVLELQLHKLNIFDIIYKLLKLTLVLPEAIASVERVFSYEVYEESTMKQNE